MDIVTGIAQIPRGLEFVLAVGMFDGVHRGHAAVLDAAVRGAHQLQATPVVMTFDPHPDAVLRGTRPPLLCDPAEKMERLAAAGAGLAVVCPFDRQLADQSPEDFLRQVAQHRHLRGLVMSPETAFGRGRAGTVTTVGALSREMGFEVVRVGEALVGGERVSSSRIRADLEHGRLAAARRLMGRDYAVVGTVVHGDGRGRQLGYPTANFAFDEPVVLPANGIYAARIGWGGDSLLQPKHHRPGVAALGVRPTFGLSERVLEVHLFDFDGDLYGQRLRMEFVRRQRGERRFASVDALIRQMDRDAERAREILAA